MNKKIIFFLILILLVSIWVNFYLFYFMKEDNQKKDTWREKNIIEKNSIQEKKKLDDDIDENFSRKLYETFLKIQSLEDFKNFQKDFGLDEILVFIMKSWDKKSWDKFWWFKYDYYIEQEDIYFLNDVKKLWGNPREQFLSLLWKKFDEIEIGIKSVSNKDLEMDINVYFNSLPLHNALGNCKILRKSFPVEYKWDGNHCEDKIYLYRATKVNNYCDKIDNSYIKNICKDFLDYQEKK